MKKTFELNLKNIMALALAFIVGFAPTAWAVDAHIFRVPATGAPTGASVSTTGVFEGSGANLTGIVHTTNTDASTKCAAGQYLSGTNVCDTLSTGAHTALDDTPSDGNITEGATSNSLFDHAAAASAHHVKTTALAHSAITAVGTSDHHVKTVSADISHDAITGVSTSDHHVKTVDTNVDVDDIAINGATADAISSNWAFDHDADAAAHHAAVTTLAHSALSGVTANQHHTPTVDTFVTGKDSHDHLGGDGATILHSSLGSIGASDHHTKTTTLAHSAITSIGTSDHHVKTVDTNTNANTQCAAGQYLDGGGSCITDNGILAAYEGKKTQANICLDTPAAAGNLMTQSDSPFQLWTATGTAIGQWMGSFNGAGPC